MPEPLGREQLALGPGRRERGADGVRHLLVGAVVHDERRRHPVRAQRVPHVELGQRAPGEVGEPALEERARRPRQAQQVGEPVELAEDVGDRRDEHEASRGQAVAHREHRRRRAERVRDDGRRLPCSRTTAARASASSGIVLRRGPRRPGPESPWLGASNATTRWPAAQRLDERPELAAPAAPPVREVDDTGPVRVPRPRRARRPRRRAGPRLDDDPRTGRRRHGAQRTGDGAVVPAATRAVGRGAPQVEREPRGAPRRHRLEHREPGAHEREAGRGLATARGAPPFQPNGRAFLGSRGGHAGPLRRDAVRCGRALRRPGRARATRRGEPRTRGARGPRPTGRP